jgi:hypothetical protein
MEEENLELLSRQDLQQLAKSLKIRANLKSSDLIKAIQEKKSIFPQVIPLDRHNENETGNLSSPSSSREDEEDKEETFPKTPAFVQKKSLTKTPMSTSRTANLSQQRFGEERNILSGKRISTNFDRTPSPRMNQFEAKTVSTQKLNLTNKTPSPKKEQVKLILKSAKKQQLKEAMTAEREKRKSCKNISTIDNGGWERIESRSKPGQFYYWNKFTKKAEWQKPF